MNVSDKSSIENKKMLKMNQKQNQTDFTNKAK